MPGSNSETRGRLCNSLGSSTVLEYSVRPIITLHGRITAKEYVDRLGNQVHPMNQTLFLNNDVIFQDGNAPIHPAQNFRSWFEKDEGELQHLPWPTQSPHFNIIESLWLGLETGVGNRFQPAISLKQFEDVL
jgi:hypothetical protein